MKFGFQAHFWSKMVTVFVPYLDLSFRLDLYFFEGEILRAFKISPLIEMTLSKEFSFSSSSSKSSLTPFRCELKSIKKNTILKREHQVTARKTFDLISHSKPTT